MTRKLGTVTAAVVGSHPDDVAFVVDDGRGRTVEHRAGDTVPLASAIKVVHLATYARAVAPGELDPAEPVPLPEWKRWYLPNTDGGAHPKALQRLGVTEPDDTVTLEQMVTAMIQESDNAVPDYLRDRLGDAALADAARRTLEWQPAPPGLDGLGFKGGNLPGVVTEAMTDPDTMSQLSCAV
ncbi:serine hydrolase [Rhodococcus sp. IEGM 1307]|uniref:serine hydrolase n=1 Tax=Rhodococcus sp. IEGM 1307 TaxID=3047091 RepID=UPI0024B731DF|nr:serine hydrolase [Rhodococcus sp. IEGM 1307]MDI9972136.1 serine hydrolase [Rhodococcus sp. IEGM 1307]